jgi:site-specific recombinase XerD
LRLFLATKEAEGVRPVSVRWFDYSVRRFLSETNTTSMAEIDSICALDWVTLMRERGLKPGGIRSYQSAVWTWFRWLYAQDYLKEDIARRVKMTRARDSDRTRRTATEQARDDLITVALARAEHARRNAALIWVLWSTGIRRNELAQIRLADVDFDSGTLRIQSTKNGKPRLVGIGKQAMLALHAYFIHERGTEPGPLFVARGNVALSTNAIQCVLKSLCESAGVHVSSHDFRRACAARLRAAGMDIASVMRQLGHSSPVMTILYSEAGEDAAAIRAFHAIEAASPPKRAAR